MVKVGLLSDTHNFIDDAVLRHLEGCDEIWHCGDFGTAAISDRLKQLAPLRGVYGNIDGYDIRSEFPEKLRFECEGLRVMMMHIGGYPTKYVPAVRQELAAKPTDLFISGHSHILKVIFDPAFKCLHINPGAAGIQGWHKVRTLVKLEIASAKIAKCQVVELAKHTGVQSTG